jgi:hypothetical protein
VITRAGRLKWMTTRASHAIPKDGMLEPRCPQDSPAPHAASEAQDAEADADADRAIDPRIQAMLPPDLLQTGEIILLLLKPSAWSIVLECLKTLSAVALVVVCCIWAEEYRQLPLHHNDTLLAATTLITLRLFWEFLDWMGRAYILTDRRVVRVQGVSRVQVFEVPLKKIDHTTLTFSNRERVIGLGTIVFHLFDHPYDQLHWRMIARPGEVYPIVVKAIEKYR